MNNECLFLDTETTGLRADDEIIEIAVCNASGNALINTLIKPLHQTAWPEAERVHGINPAMLKDAPSFAKIKDQLSGVLRDKELVIYNASYDCAYLPSEVITATEAIYCAMERFARTIGLWNEKMASWRWHRLTDAAEYFGYEWAGKAHRALADARATAHIWQAMEARRHWPYLYRENKVNR